MSCTTFGVIGLGGIARSQHLPNLARALHAQLKAVCDLQADCAEKTAQRYNVPFLTDHRELLADPEIDAVVVATRDEEHGPLTVEALRAGKHVYVEKPLATNEEECESVVAAQREAGRHVAVGFNRRFAPAYRMAKDILWRHGGPVNIYYRIADEFVRWSRRYNESERLITETCHIFDLLRWLTESEVATVYCASARAADEVVTLRFESGCVATILSSGHATMDFPKEHMEAIAGDRGSVLVEEFCELRAFGFDDCEPLHLFTGHVHPDKERVQSYLLAREGAAALYAVRRTGYEVRRHILELAGSDELPAEPDDLCARFPQHADTIRWYYGTSPHWNYFVDKGWLHAMDHFAESIAAGRTPETANAADGLTALAIGQAAIKSRDEERVVPL